MNTDIKNTETKQLPIQRVSGSAFTKKDMENAFNAGADKINWTKIKLTGVISGSEFTLEPIFDKWFEHYR